MPRPNFGKKSGKGGLGASALTNLRNASETLNRRVTDGVLACLLNHPALIEDYGDIIAQIENLETDQRHVLQLMMQWCVEMGNSSATDTVPQAQIPLDSEALTTHLTHHGLSDVAQRIRSDATYVHAGFAKPTTRLELVIQGLEHLLGRLHEPVLKSERVAATSRAISHPSNASLREWKLRAAADLKREGRSIDLDAIDSEEKHSRVSALKPSSDD